MILAEYGVKEIKEFRCEDSSHGEEDIRHNYIIDRSYVLRVNTAPVFTQQRIVELNRLIRRYHDFGLKAPLFLCDPQGNFLHQRDGAYLYLSEYLDARVAYEIKETCKAELIKQRAGFVAEFAERYRGVDLVDTMSMYSIFDLSAYDQLTGVDEKQENLNGLTGLLRELGEGHLAEKLEAINDEVRSELKKIYPDLPRCVFQGDENFSNLCVDERGKIIGLFDFNMAGTEVIANYLANLAFLGSFSYTDEVFANKTAEEIFQNIMESFRESTGYMENRYHFSEMEKRAYFLYARLVLISGYVNAGAFMEFLKQEETRKKTLAILEKVAEEDFSEEIC